MFPTVIPSSRRIPGQLATTLAALACAACPLAAAELTVSDLRLGVGVLSREYTGASESTLTTPGNVVTTSSTSENGRDADDNWRVQVQYVGGKLGAGGGLIWGAGVAVNHATWDNHINDAHVTTPVIDLMLGYGYAFTSNWHLELTPFAGIGRAYYSVSDNGSTDTSKEWDHYIEYGVKLGTYVKLGDSLVLGIEVPYLVGRFEPEYDFTDTGGNRVTVSDERSTQGFGLLVSLGVRF